MQRRHVLAALALPLAGCTEVLRSDDSTDAGTDPTPDSETPKTDPERTPTEETDRVTATPKTEHALGETHTHENWRLAVEALELTTTFETDNGERYEMPADEQLLVARVAVENTANVRDGWSSGLFAVVARERADGGETAASGRVVRRPTLVVEHPAFADEPDDGLPIEDLARVEHARQFFSHGHSVEPGTRADIWLVAVLPRRLERTDIAVAFDGDFQDETPFPVWWMTGDA